MRNKLCAEDNRRAWLWAALIVALLLLGAALSLFPAARPKTETVFLPPAGTILTEASRGLDDIRVDAVFDPDSRTLTGTQTLTMTNRTGQEQSALVLRSYSGAFLQEETSPGATEELFLSCYGDMFYTGGLTLSGAQVNGQTAPYHWQDDAQTVLSVPAPWAPGETLTLRLTWSVRIPDCAHRFGHEDGIFMLGNVFPTPAVWMDGAWRTDAYVGIGDPFLSECANWTVRLTLPRDYTPAATAPVTAPVLQGDTAVYTLEAPAARDFALVISDRFVSAQGMADDTLVTAYALDASSAQAMLDCARQALESFSRRWGDYVYPAFTLAQVNFPFSGMEYPGLVMIGTEVIRAGGTALEYTVAHETAHQWWAVQVGSDGWYEAWQDEALCEYALMDYIGDRHGAQARENAAYERIETALRITVPRTVTPGAPIDYFSDLTEYSQVVYQRGAALWMALENLLGKDRLDAALKDYQQQWRFRIASREDLTQLLSRHAGMDLAPLMLDYLDTEMN